MPRCPDLAILVTMMTDNGWQTDKINCFTRCAWVPGKLLFLYNNLLSNRSQSTCNGKERVTLHSMYKYIIWDEPEWAPNARVTWYSEFAVPVCEAWQ